MPNHQMDGRLGNMGASREKGALRKKGCSRTNVPFGGPSLNKENTSLIPFCPECRLPRVVDYTGEYFRMAPFVGEFDKILISLLPILSDQPA